MEFKKYQHVERYGTQEVDGIDIGTCYIFYKIDGTNGSIWLDESGSLQAGSRNRPLSLDNDNAGFLGSVINNPKLKELLDIYPNHNIYGEWLVPHSLKTYRDDAWRKFYVFDISYIDEQGGVKYIPYPEYKPVLDEIGVDYIPPLAICKNPSYDILIKCLEKTNEFLIKDGNSSGEGIVIKNYDFRNKYGTTTWAKIVTSEFKEKHAKEMGATEITSSLNAEERIINLWVTEAFIEKEYQKIVIENEGWSSKYIPMLLGKVYHELIIEDIWNILKELKNPKIDFKRLNMMVTQRIKEVKKELF